MERKMEVSPLWRIKISEQEAKEIIAKKVSEGEYFVYPDDVQFVQYTNGKFEVVIKNAQKKIPD
jgi:hypothetical protein